MASRKRSRTNKLLRTQQFRPGMHNWNKKRDRLLELEISSMTEEARIRVVHHAVLPVLMVTADTAEVTVGQDRFHVST